MLPDVVLDLGKAIQYALAPAFLLSGIGALLNVMTGWLARILDRGRALAKQDAGREAPEDSSTALERHALEPRRHLTSVAITATTLAALSVCAVIAGLFVEVMLATSLKWIISALFAAAMFALLIGLSYFLREMHLAMRTVRIASPEHESSRTSQPFSDGSATTSRAASNLDFPASPSVRRRTKE